MRILILNSNRKWTGVNSVLASLCKSWLKNGVDLVARVRNTDFADHLSTIGVDSATVSFSPHANPFTLLPLLLKRKPFDVVISNMEKDIVMAGLTVGRAFHVTLCGSHGDFSGKTRDTWIRKTFGREFVFPSEFSRNAVLSEHPWVRPRQTRVVPNPVSTHLFRNPARNYYPEKLNIGYLARLRSEKNQSLLLEAINILPDGIAKSIGKVKIGGIGPDENKLKKLTEKLGLEELVSFEGFVSAAEFMKSIDIHVLPSTSEAQGLVTQEAMAAGAAVIGSNIMGIAETIEHEKNGLLFKSGDAADLAASLIRLISDAELRRYVAHNGVEKVQKKYDADCVAQMYLDWFQKET